MVAGIDHWVVPLAFGSIFAHWAASLWLARLNERHALAHADTIPEPCRETWSPGSYARAIRYSVAKSQFDQLENTCEALLRLAVLLSGALPAVFRFTRGNLGESEAGDATALILLGFAAIVAGLPFQWSAQFRLEERFGFNTMKQRLWWSDVFKSLVLLVLLGFPLLLLLLKLSHWLGAAWWVAGWLCVVLFQLAMMQLGPALILPLFNKLTPLPQGPLRDQLFKLGEQTRFRVRDVVVMDGSKRSRHSNAFFAGLGRFRRIALFDTLVAEHTADELAAVVAHEIGHYRRHHLLFGWGWSAAGLFLGFAVLGWLIDPAQFPVLHAFGFARSGLAEVLALCGLLAGPVLFWSFPVANLVSRRFEFAADRFAAETVGAPQPLVQALRKLHRDNLSNPVPHPLYSRVFYSHPTLVEREAALLRDSAVRSASNR